MTRENESRAADQIMSGYAEKRLKLPKKALVGIAWPQAVVERVLLRNLSEPEHAALRAEVMARYALANEALNDTFGIVLK